MTDLPLYGKNLVEKVELTRSPKYKGRIRWFKLKFGNGVHLVQKSRPFGNDSYNITPEEYEWIDSPKRSERMWGYCHFKGTAYEKMHPITGKGRAA